MIFDCYKTTFARKFNDAATQYLEHSGAVLTAAPLTMACWFNSDDATIRQALMSLSNSGTNGSNQFNLDAGGATAGDPLRFYVLNNAATSGIATTTTGYAANRWHHACGVAESATSRACYIDGGSKGTNTSNLTTTDVDRLAVGRISDSSPSDYLSGMIAWPAIWNVALTDAEVLLLSRGVHPTEVRPESLVAFWDFTGAETEFGLRASFPLVNSGSVPVHGPGFLQTRIPRPWLLGSGFVAGGGGGNRRRRSIICGAAA